MFVPLTWCARHAPSLTLQRFFCDSREDKTGMLRCCRLDKRHAQMRWLFLLLLLLFLLTTYKVSQLSTAKEQRRQNPGSAYPRPLSVGISEMRITAAFLDPRFPRVVRLIGFGRVINRRPLFCHFNTAARKSASFADLSTIQEEAVVLYDGFFIDCSLPDPMLPGDPSLSVSLSESRHRPGRPLPLLRMPESPPSSPGIAACVSPLFGTLPAAHLIAWIEMNRLLGVEHFLFYVFDMNPAWVRPLSYYQSKGVVTRLDWDTDGIPTSTQAVWPPPDTQLHYFGQFAAYNDCLYRVGNRFRFVMFTDLDEVIIPRNSSLSDFLASIDDPQVASFSFSNTYVPSSSPLDRRALSLAPDLAKEVPFLRSTREQRVLKSDLGAKSVVKFRSALVMGVHKLMHAANFALDFHDIPERDALLFHYRDAPRNLAVRDAGKRSKRLQRWLGSMVRAVRRTQVALGREKKTRR